MRLDKGEFQKRRKTIPKRALVAQARFKKAMRNAIGPEVHDFRFDQILDAAIRGHKTRCPLSVSTRMGRVSSCSTFLFDPHLPPAKWTILGGPDRARRNLLAGGAAAFQVAKLASVVQ